MDYADFPGVATNSDGRDTLASPDAVNCTSETPGVLRSRPGTTPLTVDDAGQSYPVTMGSRITALHQDPVDGALIVGLEGRDVPDILPTFGIADRE